jgi:succinate dehydrogenase iron-sulfur subunit
LTRIIACNAGARASANRAAKRLNATKTPVRRAFVSLAALGKVRKTSSNSASATKDDLMDTELSVSLWRGAQDGRYETYRVPQRASQTVLDVVTFVQRHIDPTLSYRFACRVGVCGSCAMTVNGKPRWTCRTHVAKVVAKVAGGGKLEIGPLENLPVIKDLAADMAPFFDKWQQAKGTFAPTQTRRDPIAQIKPDSPARQAADAAIECINCGVCYAACDTVRWNAGYLGPAALTRAWTLVNDERDGGHIARLQAIAGDGGCHACHSHQSCQELCPQALNPTAAIAALKRRTAAAYLKGEIKV